MINVAGCPTHPDWVTETLLLLAAGKLSAGKLSAWRGFLTANAESLWLAADGEGKFPVAWAARHLDAALGWPRPRALWPARRGAPPPRKEDIRITRPELGVEMVVP